MRLAINSGHYRNIDPGAVGYVTEAERNWAIANLVTSQLKSRGHSVILIESNDLQEICDKSNQFCADLFISIHCNSCDDNSARGSEVWYHDSSIKGRQLAQYIQDRLAVKMVNRDIKAAVDGVNGLYVLRNTNCPAVLVECAFVSNTQDAEMLRTAPDYFSNAIALGVNDYQYTNSLS